MPWHHAVPHAYTVVDTHCHAGLRKYEPIESLVDQMFRNGVDQAVLVQHMGEYDNRYLSECTQRFPGRFVAAMLVDVARPDAPETIARWAAWPGIRGLRVQIPCPDPVWQKADELGLAVTVRGSLADLASAETRERMAHCERATFCLEHLGFPDAAEPAPHPTYRSALRLAELPNVFLKVSGYYGFTASGYPYLAALPFARLALEAFGPRRVMWGSDFPPVSGREGYHNALAFVDLLYPGLSPDERAWLMGKTAQQAWELAGE
ncbi:MAG: amidohydrolase [Chloroflexi bacterium]|nr:amidohydrolase [Chloroflexota bacterium]